MKKHDFKIESEFTIDDKPFKIISGSIHYFRSLPETWEDKILKLKALGANTVETYIPWNLHQPYENKWSFENNLDIERFLQTAQKHDMFIIIRFGPYICAEHDFGGFPWWLIEKDGIQFRCDNDIYLQEVDKYLEKMCNVLKPFLNDNGGNIIVGQLENEYGSYGNDKTYLKKLLKLIRKHDFNEPLITSDGSWDSMLECGTLIEEGVCPTVNFGSSANEHFDKLEEFTNKKTPLMCAEFWCGWFSSWNDKEVIKTDPKQTAIELEEILKRGSVNFYMFHGGTNFGANAGANQDKENGYTPDITSYDYDALLDERGNITAKYTECKKVIEQYVDIKPIATAHIPSKGYSDVTYIGSEPILDNDIFKETRNTTPLSMEQLGFGFGYVLYTTELVDIASIKSIDLMGMADRAQVFIDGKLVVALNKQEYHKFEQVIDIRKHTKLQILVENTGRVNYGRNMLNQRKGITEGVFLNDHFFVFDWKMTAVELEYDLYANLEYKHHQQPIPQTHKYNLYIADTEQIEDTYIDTSKCGKGYIFINGFNIGRFWNVGPQYKLFVPASLLKHGANEVIVIETEGIIKDLKFIA